MFVQAHPWARQTPRNFQRLGIALGNYLRDRAHAATGRRDPRAREAYVKRYYHCDAKDIHLYDVVLDSTRLGPGLCVEIIATACGCGGADASHAAATPPSSSSPSPGP